MSTIRRQSIISSSIVYVGFALGALNTFLYARGVAPAQYGLILMFQSIGTIIYYFANLGIPAFIVKFYPYYGNHLSVRENDMLGISLAGTMIGFVLSIVVGILMKPLVFWAYKEHSAELIHYYYWIFPFGLGLALYSVLETYAWQLKESVLTNYLREVQFRLIATVLLVLVFASVLTNFDTFIKIYTFGYFFVALILAIVLVRKGKLHFVFSPSRVTRRLFRKVLPLIAFAWSGLLLFNLSMFFAPIVIAAVVPGGLTYAGVYGLALFIASVIQAPQRAISAAAVGPLSQAWKDKDYGRIQRIYTRSSINQLIFSLAIFTLIWLNFTDGILTFHLPDTYMAARYVFLFIGLNRIIDMGTGLNTQIIGASIYWRFDFKTGMILLALTLPMNYWLALRLGAVGPAIADLITFAIYNAIRWHFLYRKFNMQPFDRRTLYALGLAAVTYLFVHPIFMNHHGFIWIVLRSATYCALYGAGVLLLRLSEDVAPVWATVKKRLGIRR
ncbi:MAG TPA: oligosaccharide flippase family protein [Puia sp.]